MGDENPRNFLESDGSMFRKSLLLDETMETLMAIESETGSNVGNKIVEATDEPTTSRIFTPSQREEADNCKFIVPEPGRCIKTHDKKTGTKVFVNICKSHRVPEPPIDLTDEQLSRILGDGTDEEMDDVRIPMSIGDKRIEKDNKGNECQAYDIIINSTFYKDKILKSELFWTFLCVVSLEALDEKYKLELERNKYVVLKNKPCQGKPLPQFVRSKAGIREVRGDLPTPTSTFVRPAPSKAESVKNPELPEKQLKVERPCIVKELKTTYYAKTQPDPSKKLVINVWRYKDSPEEGEAEVYLPGLKNIKEVTISYEKDEISVKSPVGQCQIKCPINIDPEKSRPSYDPEKNILTIHLRLNPVTDSIRKNWEKAGHDSAIFK